MDLNTIPAFIVTAFVTFVSSYAVMKNRINYLERQNVKQELKIVTMEKTVTKNREDFYRVRERDLINTDEKRDELIKKMHAMDVKIAEILTIIKSKKDNA